MMSWNRHRCRYSFAAFAANCLCAWLTCGTPTLHAADAAKKAENAAAKPVVSDVTTLSLKECLAIACERQPNLRAARASHAASEAGYRGIMNLSPLAARLSPDVPVRREQAAKGLLVSQAEIQKVEAENVYDVTRMYFTYVYARQQELTATEFIEQMEVFYKIAEDLVKEGAQQDLNQFSLFRMEDGIAKVKRPRITAQTGQLLSLAALKEAMGVDQSYAFIPRDTELPVMSGNLTQQDVVALALARRPELVQASAGVDAFRLEIMAQCKIKYRQAVPTLAAGSDLHSRTVPAALRNGEYRPGALAPEMPTTLAGKREDRVARATELSARQDVLLEKTRDLVQLEAVNAFLNWQAASKKVELAKTRFESGKKMVQLSRDNAQNIKKHDVLILNEALAAESQAEYLETVFEQLKALTSLERVTAGGVKPAFPSLDIAR